MPDGTTDARDELGGFGSILRRLRLDARLSQEELAERARLSVVSISALERGRRRAPYQETIRLLADALNITDTQRRELEDAARRPRSRTFAEADADSEYNLPVHRTRLIGREGDVASVVALLREHRIVTLFGTGGIGKTRTALAVGEALRGSLSGGVWFVDLASLARGAFVADALARALGVKESPDRPLVRTLLNYLETREALLIFDNCEHVVAEVAALTDELVRVCGRIKVLATSRERLRVSGETAYRLPSLTVPARDEAARLCAADAERYAAIALFVERARSADATFRLTDADAPVVAEICNLLDGIALAIELAAARVSMLSPAALLARLDQRFRILTRGERSALPRHQTMRALIDWSYELLGVAERRLFERLSVFSGGCDLAEAVAVCADDETDEFTVLELLMSLVDKSLVMAESEGRELRYRLLESSRLYAADRLVERGDVEDVARRHARAYLRLAEQLERDRNVAPDAEWLARAGPELENFRAALSWSLGGGDVALGQRLAGELRPVWVSHAAAEGRRCVEAALELATPETPPEVTLKLRFALAHIAFVFAEYASALDRSLPLIAASAEAGDAAGKAFAEYYAGGSLVSMGRVAEAEPFLLRALAATRALGNLRLSGLVLEDLAYGKTIGTNPELARPFYAEALEIWKTIGAKRNAANGASLLAENLFLSGELDAALRRSYDSIAELRALGYTRNLIVALNNLATYLNAGDRWDEARAIAEEALALAEETEAAVARAWSLHHLAATAILSAKGPAAQTAPAVTLMGYVDAQLAARGSHRTPPERREYDRVLAVLGAILSEAERDLLMAAGASLTHERAVLLGRSL